MTGVSGARALRRLAYVGASEGRKLISLGALELIYRRCKVKREVRVVAKIEGFR